MILGKDAGYESVPVFVNGSYAEDMKSVPPATGGLYKTVGECSLYRSLHFSFDQQFLKAWRPFNKSFGLWFRGLLTQLKHFFSKIHFLVWLRLDTGVVPFLADFFSGNKSAKNGYWPIFGHFW